MDYAMLGEEIAILVNDAIAKATAPLVARIAELEAREPVPGPPGEPGADGAVGEKGAAGEQGAPGIPGRDGRDGLPGLQGEKGADGRDGVDGLGIDDLEVEHDGTGGVTLKFAAGDRVKTFAFRLPCFIDRGVFRDGDEYAQGHGVTFGGSYWLAQKDAPEGKPGVSSDWRLAVKKGRDAR